MQQTGLVVDIKDNMALIRFTRSKACERCGACMRFGDSEAEAEIKNTLHANIGDYVRVELHAKSFLQASLLAYILPLIMLMLGVAAGTRVSDVLGVVLGLVGAAAAFFLLRKLEPRFARSAKFNPRMVSLEDIDD